ncbi:hypothetical protein IF188_08070 [Microbacterium sp. NEAU-LLC]|uniref:Transposase n=1 Tax=Microbacterium helvum TaxID=2773713 RepID=A0ABR8NLY4_9MICO|nr:hypothetical protein [Microbacterium helvum]MBD3941649.1 hypothetical protein [Microbacterium helvum]
MNRKGGTSVTMRERVTMRRERFVVGDREVYGVSIRYGETEYAVIPVETEGRAALHYYAETARAGGVLGGEAAPLGRDRDYLARVALAFLDREVDVAIGQRIRRPYPESRRPSDETLLAAVRRAIEAGGSARGELAEAYGVSVNTADEWIKHARRIPGANLPPARRGRPRKTRPDGGEER